LCCFCWKLSPTGPKTWKFGWLVQEIKLQGWHLTK
jgi:hypothetical protein